MKRAELRIPDDIAHILETIRRIAQYTEGMDENGFLRNKLVQDAVIRNIEVIGEAARNIERASLAFIAEHHSIPWSTMIAMRQPCLSWLYDPQLVAGVEDPPERFARVGKIDPRAARSWMRNAVSNAAQGQVS